MSRMEFSEGWNVVMKGEHAPCYSCSPALNRAAKDGTNFLYWYSNKSELARIGGSPSFINQFFLAERGRVKAGALIPELRLNYDGVPTFVG